MAIKMLLALSMLLWHASAIYFYLEPDMKRCFKDEITKNFVSLTFSLIQQTLEMTLNILDDNVVKNYKDNLIKQKDGFNLEVYSEKKGNKMIYDGTVWPNDQYEYEADESGAYTICVSLTDSMFLPG